MVIKEAKKDKKSIEAAQEESRTAEKATSTIRTESLRASPFSVTSLILLVLTISTAWQVDYTAKLQARLTELEISFLEATEPVKSPESIEAKKYPHSHYNITLDKDGIPVDPLKEYHLNDFNSVFHVDPIFDNVYTDEANRILDTVDVFKQDYYLDYADEIEENIPKCTAYLENLKYEDDFSLAVRWESKETGFGLIAKKDFLKGEIVALYPGEVYVRQKGGKSNTDYMWSWPKSKLFPKGIKFGVDGRVRGNYLRL